MAIVAVVSSGKVAGVTSQRPALFEDVSASIGIRDMGNCGRRWLRRYGIAGNRVCLHCPCAGAGALRAGQLAKTARAS